MRSISLILLVLLLLGSCNKGKDSSATAKPAADTNAAEGSEAAKPAEPNKDLKTAAGTTLNTKTAQFSYLAGTNLASVFRHAEMELDTTIVLEGLKDGMADKVPLSQEQQQAILMDLQKEMNEHQRVIMEKQGAPNRAAAEKFLAENKTKDGVITTASGLQYKVLTKGGNKEHPSGTDFVKVNYLGKLLDGTEFDSSYKRGQPASFRCNMVIRGWIEALQLMSPGDKFELYIHPDLGYGPQGQNGIPPQALLIFEVELLEISKK